VTTLDDLKRAIAHAAAAWDDTNVSDYGAATARAEAWRTAFEWLHEGMRGGLEQTYEEGVALIREKIR
jgi:hypothetical protein